MRIMSVLAATGAGAAVGWICGSVPVWPVARFAAAAAISWFFALVASVVIFLLTVRGPVAVSAGSIKAVLLKVPAVLLAAAVSYFVLRWLGWSSTNWARYGPIIFGAGTGLIGALWLWWQ